MFIEKTTSKITFVMHPQNKLHHNWLIKKVLNEKVKSRLPDFSGRVVDLGCGTCPYRQDIIQHSDEYIGVDWGNTLHKSHAEIIADLNKPLPIPSDFADHIVSFEVLEHLAEPRTMLTEALRALKKGGSLTLSVPFQWWAHEEPWDYYRYTRHGLHYLLEQAGFTEIEISPTTGFWSMWLLKLNYQTTRLVRGPNFVRKLLRAALIPFWWTTQTIAPMLDLMWPEERETAGYFVTAKKA